MNHPGFEHHQEVKQLAKHDVEFIFAVLKIHLSISSLQIRLFTSQSGGWHRDKHSYPKEIQFPIYLPRMSADNI